jgi:hypothetical protein
MLLYRLYEVPHIRNSRVIIAGIANTLDLPQRLLPNLATKNMTPETINFKAYTAEQIAAIIRERLGGDVDRVFDSKAIELMAKKVAETCLGDCRKALNICRFASPPQTFHVLFSSVSFWVSTQHLRGVSTTCFPKGRRLTMVTTRDRWLQY